MKRLWLGVVFLAVLLAAGIWQTVSLSRIHSTLSETFSAAAAAASQQDWERADALTAAAGDIWEKHRKISAAFADHEPLEELDRLFWELPLCRAQALEDHYALVCAHLSHICDAIAESFRIPWWNVL